MTPEEWAKLLKSYRTSKRVVKETLEGIVDHIDTTCKTNETVTIATPGSGKRGLPPFHQELVVCDRGTRGCNLKHNDGMALVFSRMAFERLQELETKKG